VGPAPTRRSAARRRGGDPIARIAAAAAACGPLTVAPGLRTTCGVRDSVGLSSAGRERNITGRVRAGAVPAGEVLLVDDVVTTGATAREAVRTLVAGGAQVSAVLTLAQA
jgi:predicted amidophosphoribosyltransferase